MSYRVGWLLSLFGGLAAVFALLAFDARTVEAQSAGEHPGLKPFKTTCTPCHTIGGGKLVGPDLAGVDGRVKDKQWAIDFIKDPKAMNDDYAKKIRAEFGDTMAPQGAIFSDQVIKDIVDFLWEGGPGLSTDIMEIDKTKENIELGRKYFSGEERFENRGPACISCHSVADLGWLGGGTMAATVSEEGVDEKARQAGKWNRDLMGAYNRNGQDGMAAVLLSPQFPVMKGIFAKDNHPLTDTEVNALVAYFGHLSASGDDARHRDYFWLWGVLGAIGLLALLNFAWRGRFTAVRRPIVEGEDQ